MAITGKIRERSTLVLIIVGGAIMAFVLTDLFSSQGMGQMGPTSIAEINGTKVSPAEFDVRLQEAYENYQANMQLEGGLDEETKSDIREQVWNNILSEVIIESQMDELGINVTSKELFDMVQGDEPHPQIVQAFRNPETGQFDKASVIQFLQNLNQDPELKRQWIKFEQALKKEHRTEKLGNLLTKGIYLPTELAKMSALEDEERISFKYLYKEYATIDDAQITVSDKEMRSYYDANKSEFIEKANIKLLYAYFPVDPSELDISQTEKAVDELYNGFAATENDSLFVTANSDEKFDPTYYSYEDAPEGVDSAFWTEDIGYMVGPIKNNNTYTIYKLSDRKEVPDSVKASHILINVQDRSLERAEEITDSLMQLLEDGAKMEDLAPEHSDDVASAREGGDLGWFTEGVMVKPFNDAAFSAEIGSYTKVLSQFGYHIIEVTDQTSPVEKVQVAKLVVNATPGNETYANVFNKANSFSIEVTDLESFNNLVSEKNIQRRSISIDDKSSSIPGLPVSRDIVRWAKGAKENQISEAYDVGEAFVVVAVESVSEDGVAPFEKVKNRVEYAAKKEKKAQNFKDELNGVGATNLDAIATALNLEVHSATDVTFANPHIPASGLEPKVIGKAMSLNQGQLSVPLKGEMGVYMLQVDSKEAAGDIDVERVRVDNLNSIKMRYAQGELLKALEKKSDIKDNRSVFY